jgi:hypothetical protein
MKTPTADSRAGRFSPISLLSVFLIAFGAAPVLCGWGADGHEIVTREAAQRLPPPLSTYLLGDETLKATIGHDMDPDRDDEALRKTLDDLAPATDAAVKPPESASAKEAPQVTSEQAEAAKAWQAARSKHFFDLDALTDEAPPYAHFPRARSEAEKFAADFLIRTNRPLAAELLGLEPAKLPPTLDEPARLKLGQAALLKFGSLPWVIQEQEKKLAEAFRAHNLDKLPEVIGVLSHYVADLHQPLHTTRNFDGQLTGNSGVHLAFEISIIKRNRKYYETMPPAYLKPYEFVATGDAGDVTGFLFSRIGENGLLAPKIMAADSAARAASGATPEDFKWLKEQNHKSHDWLDSLLVRQDLAGLDPREVRLLRHTDALQDQLVKTQDDLARRCLGAASSNLASLIYTAWLEADRPSLAKATPTESELPPANSWMTFLPLAAAMAILLLLLSRRRRRRAPPPSQPPRGL